MGEDSAKSDEKLSTTLPGTVEEIIKPADPREPEKAHIAIDGAEDLDREIRVDNIEPFWRWTMRRIGTMLLVFIAALTVVAQKSAEHVKTYTPDAIHWGAAPNALPPGAELSVLEGNPMAPGAYTMRLKMLDGYKIPPHHHLRREHVTVISGAFKVGMGDSFDAEKMNEFAPGSFAYLEPTVHHYAMAKGETVIQLHGTGPWEIKYVNPADDPRHDAKSGEAKKQ
jgi:mannose-6-phosphate isomerase-like protein (cupin superfamily)